MAIPIRKFSCDGLSVDQTTTALMDLKAIADQDPLEKGPGIIGIVSFRDVHAKATDGKVTYAVTDLALYRGSNNDQEFHLEPQPVGTRNYARNGEDKLYELN